MSQQNDYLNVNDFERAKIDLKKFVEDVRALRASDLDSAQFQSMYQCYKRLYNSYKEFSPEHINQNFEIQEVKIIEVLALGAQAEGGFNEILSKIQSDAGQTAVAVAQFIKTRAGFDLVHAKTFEKFTNEDLVQIFGSLLGVRIAKDCVGQLASERVGSIIGYALSGRCSEDMKEYQELKQKHPDLALGDFLKQKIAKSDHEMIVYESSTNGQVSVHSMINENKGSPAGAVRSHHRADHCFVKHSVLDTQGNIVEKGRIVVGLSTNAKDMALQGKSFFKTLAGTKLLTEQKQYAGKPNPYYRYEVESFYFMGGRFVAHERLEPGRKNEIGRALLAQLNDSSVPVETAELNNLAQFPFFSLIANAQNARQCAQILQFNSFIAGADTSEIYEQQQKAFSNSKKEKSLDESFLKTFLPFISEKMCSAIDTMVSRNVSLEKDGREQLSLIVSDMREISSRIVQNFAPIIDKDLHETALSPLSTKLSELHSHLWESGKNDYGNILKDIKKNARTLSDWEQVKEEIADNKDDFVATIKWDSSFEQSLAQRVYGSVLEQKVGAKLTHDQESKSVIVGEYLLKEAELNGVSAYLQKFIQDYQKLLRVSVEKQMVPNIEVFMNLSSSTFTGYTGCAIRALKQQGADDLADWLANTRHLLKSEPSTENRMKKANTSLMKLVNDLYPLVQYTGVIPVPTKGVKF